MKHNYIANDYISEEMIGKERTNESPSAFCSLMFPWLSPLTFLDCHKGPFQDVNVEFAISAKYFLRIHKYYLRIKIKH